MITSLTKEQEKQIPKFIDKWIKKASEPMNHNNAKKYLFKMYEKMGEEKPIVIIGSSPLNTALLCGLFWDLLGEGKEFDVNSQLDSQLYNQLYNQLNSQLNNQLNSQIYSQLNNQLDSQIYSQLRNQLRNQLYNQLNSQLNNQLYNQLRNQLDSQLYNQLYNQLNSQLNNQLDSQLRNQLYNQLRNQLYNQLRNQLNNQLRKINNDWYMGFWWLAWCGYYDYGKYIGVDFDKENYDLFMNFNSEIQFIIPYKKIAFISEKPTEIHWKNARLHNEKGLAVGYADDYGLYCLNGITVPEWLVNTPAKKIDPKKALEEKNVDVQREIIRKVGVERILKATNAKEIDIFTYERLGLTYKLVALKLNEVIDRKYLYFESASLPGVYYCQPIPPETTKALHGLAWMRSLVERKDLNKLDSADEAEIIAHLPDVIS
jgi:hypothetical protein